MSRKLFSIRGKKWIAEFEPKGGFKSGKRGVRRSLCSVDDISHLSKLEQSIFLTDLYEKKLKEIMSESISKEKENNKKKRKEKFLLIDEAAKLWVTERRSEGRADKTLGYYMLSISFYIKACGNHMLSEYDEGKLALFKEFLRNPDNFNGKTLSDDTQYSHIKQLRNFLYFSRDRGYLSLSGRVKMIELPKKDMETISIDQLKYIGKIIIEKMNEYKETKKHIDYLNIYRAYVMAINTAARVGVIWSLLLENINIDSEIIYVRDNAELSWVNKKKKYPNKPINNTFHKFLQNDLSARSNKEKYYLDNGNGKPWRASTDGVTRFLRRILDEAGISKSIKPFHWAMRATIITEMLVNGANIYDVQKLADHSDIQTTMMYLNTRKTQQKVAVEKIDEILNF